MAFQAFEDMPQFCPRLNHPFFGVLLCDLIIGSFCGLSLLIARQHIFDLRLADSRAKGFKSLSFVNS